MRKDMLARAVGVIRRRLPGVVAVYVFGSAGSAGERADSDVDMAILPATPIGAKASWELGQEVAADIGRDVDLVDLLAASTVMRGQAISTGSRIYCADENACAAFEDYAYASYARLNEERGAILDDIRRLGSVYG